jgi:hypothetical protein
MHIILIDRRNQIPHNLKGVKIMSYFVKGMSTNEAKTMYKSLFDQFSKSHKGIDRDRIIDLMAEYEEYKRATIGPEEINPDNRPTYFYVYSLEHSNRFFAFNSCARVYSDYSPNWNGVKQGPAFCLLKDDDFCGEYTMHYLDSDFEMPSMDEAINYLFANNFLEGQELNRKLLYRCTINGDSRSYWMFDSWDRRSTYILLKREGKIYRTNVAKYGFKCYTDVYTCAEILLYRHYNISMEHAKELAQALTYIDEEEINNYPYAIGKKTPQKLRPDEIKEPTVAFYMSVGIFHLWRNRCTDRVAIIHARGLLDNLSIIDLEDLETIVERKREVDASNTIYHNMEKADLVADLVIDNNKKIDK